MKFKDFFKSKQKCIKIYDFVIGHKIEEQRRKNIIEQVDRACLSTGVSIENNPPIIISLTSYPKRFPTLHKVLKSLLLQTKKPNKIMVYLDCNDKELTNEMLELEEYGVEYVCNVQDLKPHKKYYYAMQDFPDSLIITVDDDCYYSADLVESLYSTWLKYPDCVCARRVHLITRDNKKKINTYNKWEINFKGRRKPSHWLIATGVGGVLYPPKCLDKRAFDVDLIMKTSLYQDDLWLKMMELLNGTKVVWVPSKLTRPALIDGSQEEALANINVNDNGNDICIQTLLNTFGKEIGLLD